MLDNVGEMCQNRGNRWQTCKDSQEGLALSSWRRSVIEGPLELAC
jgi:hypothetical protein